MLPQDSCIILIFVFEYKMHTRDHYSPYVIYNTKLYQLKNRIHARGKEDNGSQNKHLAINKAIQLKSQYEDGQKYSTTRVNINCPRTMSIRKYFPGE